MIPLPLTGSVQGVCNENASTTLCATPLQPHLPQVLRPVALSEESMYSFHTKEYINFLKNVTPENQVSSALLPIRIRSSHHKAGVQPTKRPSAHMRRCLMSNANDLFHVGIQHCSIRLPYQPGCQSRGGGRLPLMGRRCLHSRVGLIVWRGGCRPKHSAR